jgi:hypothetical protein
MPKLIAGNISLPLCPFDIATPAAYGKRGQQLLRSAGIELVKT